MTAGASPRCIAVVPYREHPAVKTRLADELSLPQRLTLARSMLSGVLRALLGATAVAEVLVVGDTAPPAEFAGVARVAHLPTTQDLNRAVALGCETAAARAATEVLIAHADLPDLDAARIDALVATGRALRAPRRAALASCQQGDGTNVLWLAPAEPIAFAYGRGSYRRHLALLGELGYAVAELPPIADVDSRADLERLLPGAALLLAPPGAGR